MKADEKSPKKRPRWAARLTLIREGTGLSQAAFAKELGLSNQQTYGLYETGQREPRFATLVRLRERFGVSLDFLIAGPPQSSNAAAGQNVPDAPFSPQPLYPEIHAKQTGSSPASRRQGTPAPPPPPARATGPKERGKSDP